MNLVKWQHAALALATSLWLAGCSTTGNTAQHPGTDATIANPAQGLATPSSAGSGQKLRKGTGTTALRAPDNIWERIRRGYAMPNIDTDLVRQQESWYASRPEYIERMTERSRRYIFHIVEQLEQRSMPTELALLPFVESAFRPDATSPAKAAGLWQFMPGTGAHFNLRQNSLRDERRDVVDSTRAALDYLEYLHDMFDDWHLALAAYNWGEGNVQRAINRNRAAGLGTSYLELRMPAETRHYVPKLQAMKNIVSDPARFGGQLPNIGNRHYFDSVTITHDIDVAVAARLAAVPLEDFKALNPSHRKPVIFAAGTPRILLPWENAAIFRENLRHTPVNMLASWTAWVTPEKMRPAEIAQRFGMSEEDFRAMNSIPRGRLIASGSTVLVRRSDGAASTVAAGIVNNARLALVSEAAPRRATSSSSSSLRRTAVRARKGDTLASIAARYGVPTATLQRWNGGAKKLRAGQSVALYLPKRTASAKSTKVANAKPAAKTVTKASAKDNAKTATKVAAAKPAGKSAAKAGAKTVVAKAEQKSKTANQTAKDSKNSKPAAKTDARAGVKVAKADPKAKPAKQTAAKPAAKSAEKNVAKGAAKAAQPAAREAKGSAKAKAAPAKKTGSSVKVARSK